MTVARGRTGDPGPAARPSATASRPPASAAPAAARVLLVEDEPGMLRALFINLRARQYDVSMASTGREALATAASRPPDAVILDLGLPDIDGTEVIVELRRWSRAPIIVLSGRASPGDKIGALDVGADDYVTKPFSMAELLARLRAVLRRDDPGPAGVSEAVVGHCVIDLTAHTVTRRPAQDAPAPAGGTPLTAARLTARPATRTRPATARPPARRSGSLPPNGAFWRAWSTTRASWSARGSCSPRSGGPGTSPAPTTCGSTWPSCAASWRTTRRGPVTCSPSRAWATGTGHEYRPVTAGSARGGIAGPPAGRGSTRQQTPTRADGGRPAPGQKRRARAGHGQPATERTRAGHRISPTGRPAARYLRARIRSRIRRTGISAPEPAGAGLPPHLPGRRRGGRQDLRHAGRGPPPGRARRRSGGRLRRDARAPAHPGAARRPGGHPAQADDLPRGDLRGDGPRRRAGPSPADRAGRRARAHQRARVA